MMHQLGRLRAAAWLAFGLLVQSHAQEIAPKGETILTNAPPGLSSRFGRLDSGSFTNLHLELINSRLHMFCELPGEPLKAFTVLYSLGSGGRWISRDWRSYPAALKGKTWDCVIPVETLDLPFVYFAVAESGGGKKISPLHLAEPEYLGMKSVTQPFWNFLEGFEQGLEGWFPGGADNTLQIVASPVKTGKAALQLAIPARKNSAVALTTRVRGAQLSLSGSLALTIQARSNKPARLRFTLYESRGEPNQRLYQFPNEIPVGSAWKSIELPFPEAPALRLMEVDAFAVEAIGEPLTEVFLDDLALIGGAPKIE